MTMLTIMDIFFSNTQVQQVCQVDEGLGLGLGPCLPLGCAIEKFFFILR